MTFPFDVSITDYQKLEELRGHVEFGHYFVFVDPEVSGKKSTRRTRLLVDKSASDAGRVIPIANDPIELPGVTLTPHDRSVDPISCVVSDRDLYRAEQDTVNLFVAMPVAPHDLKLVVELAGDVLTERELEIDQGIAVETLSMLLPGEYSAQLVSDGKRIGTPSRFTVAEYTLAPLSGRLARHELDRSSQTLRFDLRVESYQVPYDGKLRVALVENGRELEHTHVKASEPGVYGGSISIKKAGEGPFRLRLSSVEDSERVAEVAIPGTRKSERDTTVISELGTEYLFSMMPEASAFPVRGGYLSMGDSLATPVIVKDLITDSPTLIAKTDLEGLTLVVLDLATGELKTIECGTVKADEEIPVDAPGPMTTVFAGAYVGGRAFEGFASFIRKSDLALKVRAPEQIRPEGDLKIELSCEGRDRIVPVLLCVRDERLTATDRPEVSLGAAAKKAIASATAGMDERGFTTIDDAIPVVMPPQAMMPTYAPRGGGLIGDMIDRVLESTARPASAELESDELYEADDADERVVRSAPPAPEKSGVRLGKSLRKKESQKAGRVDMKAKDLTKDLEVEIEVGKRSEFPELLFYGVVAVEGTTEVLIPMSDSLGTFTIEAFVMSDGDWAAERTEVVVDQPVRVDLEVPPAVHTADHVVGRLRAASGSGRARITLTCNGKDVELSNGNGDGSFGQHTMKTPVELEFQVSPGTYVARVEDYESGEVDLVEMIVSEPGKFKSYAKELALLQPGDQITLDSADALSLRVLPAVQETFDTLMSATAGYAHLCCEQTAAKILAATFMYMTAKSVGKRRKAERIILAGIARERKMLRPGQGFSMYPNQTYISDHYSQLAVRYLWTLSALAEDKQVSKSLRKAAREGVSLADQAGNAHGMARVPKSIHSVEDAYAASAAGVLTSRAQAFVNGVLDFSGKDVRIKDAGHAVANRALLAYAAATLVALGDLKNGVRAANEVTRQFNDQGRLYSTVDSAAALCLMLQLRASGVVKGDSRVRVNGQVMTAMQATELSDQIESVEVEDGVAAIEVLRIVEEDWDSFQSSMPVRIGFRDEHDKKVRRFKAGDKTELVVALPDGYQPGDLVHVALPAAMSWIRGGGKVKRFTVDFEGENEIRIPVVVTGKLEGKQHFAACVRNMFEEERGASPGLLVVDGGSKWWS